MRVHSYLPLAQQKLFGAVHASPLKALQLRQACVPFASTVSCVQNPDAEQHELAGQSDVVTQGHCVSEATQRPFPQHTGASSGQESPLKLRQFEQICRPPVDGASAQTPEFAQQENAGHEENAPQVQPLTVATHLPFGQQTGKALGHASPLNAVWQLGQSSAPEVTLTGVCVQNPSGPQQDAAGQSRNVEHGQPVRFAAQPPCAQQIGREFGHRAPLNALQFGQS